MRGKLFITFGEKITPDQSFKLRFVGVQRLLRALSFVPPVVLVLLILKFGVDFIDWDQWEIANFFDKASHGSLTFGDLFAQQAEYRQFFPNMIFVGLGWLTHWNIKYEMLVSFVFACLIAFNIYHLSLINSGASRERRLLLTLTSNLLIFAPAQFENWLLGEQIIYFMPLVCLTTALRVAYSNLSQAVKLLICASLATISAFSSANGMVLWIVLAPVLLFSNLRQKAKLWNWLIWSSGFILNLALYLFNYRKPVYTPGLFESVYNPVQGAFFFCSLLGAPLIDSYRLIFVCAAIGIITLTLFAACCFYVIRHVRDAEIKRQMLCWWSLGAYSVITAVIITFARTGFGLQQSLNSRYTTFTIYLIVALVYFIPLIVEDMQRQERLARIKFSLPRLIPFAFFALLLLHLFNSEEGIRKMARMKILRLQSKACLLFINAAPGECLTKEFPSMDILQSRTNAMNDLGYLRPALIKSNEVKEIAEMTRTDSHSAGHFEHLAKAENAVLPANGWARVPEGAAPADAVLLTYQKDQNMPVIFALAEMKTKPPTLAAFFTGSPAEDWRWQKSISLDNIPASLPFNIDAWSFDATTGKAYRLDGTFIIESAAADPRLQETGKP